MMDADLATDLKDYDKIEKEVLINSNLIYKLKRIERNGLGIVAGSRNHLVKDVVTTRKWYRNLLMYLSNFIINQICGVKLKVSYFIH